MNVSTLLTLVLFCFTICLKSAECLRYSGKGKSMIGGKGKLCVDNFQCTNSTACLPAGSSKKVKRCQECLCREPAQCIKRKNEVICDCSDSGYTGVYCETAIEPACPNGWHLHGSSCYLYVQTPADWSTAQLQCQSLNENAHLIEITDSDENIMATTLSGSTYIWTGLTDADEFGIFRWINSGNVADFIPGNDFIYYYNYENYDCVYLANTYWVNAYCGGNNAYICEMSLV